MSTAAAAAAAAAAADRSEKVRNILESEPRSGFLLRRWIALSVLVLYFFIGVPLWFKLTEIYRAPLPANFINLLQKDPNVDISITNKVYLNVKDGLKYPDLAEAVQIQVDSLLHNMNQDPNERLIVDWNVTLIDGEPESEKDHVLTLEIGDSEGIHVFETKKETVLYYTLASVKNNDLPFFITQSLLQHTFKSEIELFQLKNQKKSIHSIQYSPKVHLSFKLLTGDGYPVDWDIDNTLETYFKPVIHLFRNFVDFTVDSEIKYFADLNLPETSNRTVTISQTDLPTILDFSEWDVTSNQFAYPTLNFIIYFPSSAKSPLNFDFENGRNSFLIPQWGAVLLNAEALKPNSFINEEYLRPALDIFTSELFNLLGLPKHPRAPLIRVDAFKKYTIVNNLIRGIDSLVSLLKLSESLPNISVPKTVQNNVRRALGARQSVVEKLNRDNDFNGALIESVDVLKYSEQAFFDREMVQQTFFPQEHKIAVYMPLIGPVSLILLLAARRIVHEIKFVNKKKE